MYFIDVSNKHARQAVHTLLTAVPSLTAVIYKQGHHKRHSRAAMMKLLDARSGSVLAACAAVSASGVCERTRADPEAPPKLVG